MKMIIAIIGSEDADDLVYELNQHSFFVTKLSTMGGVKPLLEVPVDK